MLMSELVAEQEVIAATEDVVIVAVDTGRILEGIGRCRSRWGTAGY